ncbi:MAG: DsbA family protein [Proteobacteria bacterium]|nr:DsbA family protein [Pseudomonadota bacterium]
MIIAKRLKGKAIAAWLGPTGDAARRAVASVKQTIARTPTAQTLDFYFEIADPWSYLAAQALQRLIAHYGVAFTATAVTPPASDVNPMPLLRDAHAVRDARELAAYWNLEFPAKKPADSGLVRDVGTVLVKSRPAGAQLQAMLDLGAAMWTTDRKQVAKLVGQYGFEGHNDVLPILNESYAALRKAGHYQGGMIQYAGEWYWGIDRLAYLEEVLARDTGKPVAHVVAPRPEAERGPEKLSDKPLTCELWFSFRSPYSYLALEQIEAVLGPDVELVLRPILPMVTRGLTLPQVKRFYIVRDVKREADRIGLPFGELCDPLGTGVTNCLAIAKWAQARSSAEALAFAKSAMRGIWTEARDMAEYVDLKFVVERAGLPWDEARAAMAPEHAEAVTKWATTNATDLGVVGLWGVPSYRVGDFVTWGNDRLPLLADRLRRHRAAM